MKPEIFDIQQIIDYLQGTCNTLNEGVTTCYPNMTEDDLTEDDHNAIDQDIFLCETCGWWCEQGDSGDSEGNCLDCNNEIDED